MDNKDHLRTMVRVILIIETFKRNIKPGQKFFRNTTFLFNRVKEPTYNVKVFNPFSESRC